MLEQSSVQKVDDSTDPLLNPEQSVEATEEYNEMDTYSRDPVVVGQISREEDSPLLRAKSIENEDGLGTGGRKKEQFRRTDRIMNFLAFVSNYYIY